MSTPGTSESYPRHGGEVPASPRFPEIEERVLRYWDADGTFRASVEARPAGTDGDNEYVFYDGPPFANGLPHYGHLLTGYVKDVVPRFRTMQGRRVERRFGWDTHGLPAELEAMSQLGIKTKDEILELGIEAFNARCRSSVLRYTDEWQEYVTRQARWVDFENDYKTLEPDYMESVIWAFKTLHDKGLVYEGFRVLPYCWNDQTPLSNHELRMDEEVYRSRQDPAVTVGLRLETGELALVWTTTPWTLPANLAIMVDPGIDYVVVESDATGTTERYVLAEARLGAYARELGEEPAVVQRLTGADLVGRAYTPPFRYYAGHARAHRVVEADFVTTTDGTGLVHSAGAFGEEDKLVTDREGIEPVMPVGPDGAFTAPVGEYAGLLVFDANGPIMDHLKAATRGEGDPGQVSPGTVLLRRETYDHSYPHCWRCREPLIYKAVSSWFVAVTKVKDRMVELNEQIEWVPGHVKDGQFGKWLANARDWSISRNRFWGSPIPVWRSDDPAHPRTDVYGSFEELERDFGRLPRDAEGRPDLHRPFVDQLTRPNPDDPTGRSTMRRVEDVLDVWFDSGSMSFAQVHHPFENAEWFEHHFPANFIVEYIGQTRGWFYTLHVLATALFDRPAFATCLVHGIVLGDDGQKMSKSLRNYPDVREVFDRDGADAMRWFLMSSPVLRGGNLVVTEQGIRDTVRQVLLPLWSTWYFLSLYAGAAGTVGRVRTDSTHVLDRYLLATVRRGVERVTAAMEANELAVASAEYREVLEALTNWYVRRSRDRFWTAETPEGQAAVDTLHTALEVLTRLGAPLLPLVTEEIWRGLTGGRSVHLADWPDPAELPADDVLVAAMDQVREIASTALGLRKAAGLRVRQPLTALTVALPEPDAVADLTDLLLAELNVHEVRLMSVDRAHEVGVAVEQRLAVNARAAGPRLGRQVQQVIAAARAGEWEQGADGVVCGGVLLLDGEYELTTVVGDGSGAAAALPGGGLVVLDTTVTDALEREGWARDVVRLVQDARREAGLHVSDRVRVDLEVAPSRAGAAEEHRDLVARETLAADVLVRTGDVAPDTARVLVARA